jgi:NADH dehydrogenase (ubiquinone) 1 beta subcomplex subunit 8
VGYPALSSASRQLRNPKGWWDNQERVNFGEPVRTVPYRSTPSRVGDTHPLTSPRRQLEKVPENDDIQSMWAPDVHAIKPSSALSQLLLMFGAVGLFAFGVYEMRAQPHAVSWPTLIPSFFRMGRRI